MKINPVETKASIIRARAIRLADTLSRIKVTTKRVVDTVYWREDAPLPPVTSWPEIDVDPLLPWNNDWWAMIDDGAEPAIWPIDHAMALPEEDGGVQISFASTVPFNELRGKARRVLRYNARVGVVNVDQYGVVTSWGGGLFGRIDRKWISLERGGNFVAGCDAHAATAGPSLAIGNALRLRYEWSAIFSYPSGIRLRYGCSAQGALQLFRDRNAPEEGRRAALLHWVRRHWRQTSDPAVMRQVREHLRGVTKFEWRRQEVSLIPAEYELERAEAS